MAKKQQNTNDADQIEDELVETSQADFNESDFGEIFATWQFPEHIKHIRSKKWYIYFGLIYLIILLISIFGFYIPLSPSSALIHFGLAFDRSYFLTIIMVMFIIIYLYLERKDIENFAIAITEDGILLNNKLIEYRDLSNFYIVYYPPQIKNLYFQPKNFFGRLIVVPLEDENPVIIRRALLQYLPEDLSKEHMPTTESISRLIKF
jgi:hypothetical protein